MSLKLIPTNLFPLSSTNLSRYPQASVFPAYYLPYQQAFLPPYSHPYEAVRLAGSVNYILGGPGALGAATAANSGLRISYNYDPVNRPYGHPWSGPAIRCTWMDWKLLFAHRNCVFTWYSSILLPTSVLLSGSLAENLGLNLSIRCFIIFLCYEIKIVLHNVYIFHCKLSNRFEFLYKFLVLSFFKSIVALWS